MHRNILRTLTIAGLVLGTSTIAIASPAMRLLDRDTAPQASNIERVDYNWHHHRYHHRSWDKRHGHWRYYD
jgi:hypothetical protein